MTRLAYKLDAGLSAGRHASRWRPAPRGLTLVELLITMAIIAIISAAIMGTAAAAIENARRSRTQILVTRIHTLLMDRWTTYESRRVDLNPAALTIVNMIGADNPQNPQLRGEALADLRLIALRELMKFEMPDRWSDVADIDGSGNATLSAARVLAAPPALTRTYFRRYMQARSSASLDDVDENNSAECLFLTVMLATGDGEARSLFSDQDIGDVDGDGCQEFIDGWGNPISWIRWPAGFVGRSRLMSGNPETDHDPFDSFRRHQAGLLPNPTEFRNLQPFVAALRRPPQEPPNYRPAGFRLVPLVYSNGPDGIPDIDSDFGDAVSASTGDVLLNPYALESDNTYQVGFPEEDPSNRDGDDNSIDNIHSHQTNY